MPRFVDRWRVATDSEGRDSCVFRVGMKVEVLRLWKRQWLLSWRPAATSHRILRNAHCFIYIYIVFSCFQGCLLYIIYHFAKHYTYIFFRLNDDLWQYSMSLCACPLFPVQLAPVCLSFCSLIYQSIAFNLASQSVDSICFMILPLFPCICDFTV